MLEQYVRMRDEVAAHLPHAILLFQVGDFYETFGEDAERAARLLGIALTHKSSRDFSTPMAGVPVLAAVSAPSSLAVELAEEVGITLIGFLRGDGCNVYTRTERLLL